jgi:hypothetical protein
MWWVTEQVFMDFKGTKSCRVSSLAVRNKTRIKVEIEGQVWGVHLKSQLLRRQR